MMGRIHRQAARLNGLLGDADADADSDSILNFLAHRRLEVVRQSEQYIKSRRKAAESIVYLMNRPYCNRL